MINESTEQEVIDAYNVIRNYCESLSNCVGWCPLYGQRGCLVATGVVPTEWDMLDAIDSSIGKAK